ncbi:nitrate reductase cytochrome c-type subunit [Sphingomonas cavernae]|uniref:Periplasmic nitrate reductase, electron transfer subunit n=1 Tax=Sphingomonas cavernae TaxID=2320861 RepID=A0A418WS82_9SPHN|nr:nitrate reductase cytochrome c-type subunit [Sphingomonas cavernae]RJF94120.1 nitrate reductase cytochrome c-type subunit [Sphingomonas cavernae]
MRSAISSLLALTLALGGCGSGHEEVPGKSPDDPVVITNAGQQIDAMRRGVPIDKEASPPPMARVENFDRPRPVNYEMQPPTIPHAIDNYQLTVNTNRCMLCHTRSNAVKFQAPPVSENHYVTREGKVLEQISSRRYFCVQCHVVQTDAPPLVDNNFKGIEISSTGEAAR